MNIQSLPHKLPKLKPDLLIIGQATIDDINREDEGLVAERIPGGDSVYAALGASFWPTKIGVVTIVGQDYPYEKMDLATCNPEATDWAGLTAYPGPSMHARAFYSKDGGRIFKWDDFSLTTKLSPGVDDVPELWRDVNFVHLAPSDPERQLELIRYFSGKGAIVSLDVEKHFFKAGKEAIIECLKLDPIFIPSVEHVQLLSGIQSDDIDDLWPWISNCGVSLAVIKYGSQGAWIIDGKQREKWHIGVVENLHLVDVTGAGDSFCGGFMAGFIITRDYLQAAAYGAVSASFIVESLGARKTDNFQKALAEQRLAEMVLKITAPKKMLGN
jgi:sugar/nucleoside kinase (ribokinase family)